MVRARFVKRDRTWEWIFTACRLFAGCGLLCLVLILGIPPIPDDRHFVFDRVPNWMQLVTALSLAAAAGFVLPVSKRWKVILGSTALLTFLVMRAFWPELAWELWGYW